MQKLRVLFVNEASYLNTGFSTYGHEVLNRLHATGKFDLAEFAVYGDITNPQDGRWRQIPWGFYPNMPDQRNPREVETYHANPVWQFGEWKFEATCVDFRPDVVVDIRDWWMLEFEERSPFRRFYNWSIMPTVDAAPQDEQWVSTYANADAVFTYSDWGLEQLRNQSNGAIKTICSAPPGAELDTFVPVPDKRAHRARFGMDPDAFVVGTIMRNQRRKLYPDLVEALALFLKRAPEELAKKTYLYIHTSFPDNGWDLPRLVKEAGVGHKTVFTYFCQSCGVCYPSHFQDAKAICQRCGSPKCGFPNSASGISRKALAQVLNSFDVYVQYANSEGFGMPQVEAAACGVPVMSVDYSAMADVVRKVKGTPIPVQRMFRESETHCWRALPDNSLFVDQLIKFLQLPVEVKARKGFEARKAVEQHYTYEKTAKIWEDHLDTIKPKDHALTWGSPAKIHAPNLNVPAGLSDDQFVKWGMLNIAGRPDLLNSWTSLRMVRDLSWGITTDGTGGLYFNDMSSIGMTTKFRTFDRQIATQELMKLCDQQNFWERARTSK